jgi:hypothetical protein
VKSVLVALALLLATSAPAHAQGVASEGGISSENVEWLDHHEDSAGVAEGGRLVGTTFFMTNNNQGLFAYDVSTPETPKRVGHLPLVHAAENEDVTTNGRILLLSQLGDVYHLSDGAARQGHWVNVIDVRDPANMKVIARVDGGGDHTWDCLLDCTWAYSSSGQILDLRDPTKPKLLEQRWRDVIEQSDLAPGFAHDVTEVAPGWVMAASYPMFLMDARDPTKPKVVATGPEDNANAGHNIVWPRQMQDRYIVTASEGQNLGRCEAYEGQAQLQIWDSTDWKRTGTFTPAGSYGVTNGTQADGQPPASATWYGCSAHWAEVHPYWNDGGLLAGAFYSHGARLLQVADGEPKEIGYFLSHGAGASAVYWITDRILYVADDTRGLDVIRYTGTLPPPPTTPAPVDVRRPVRPAEPLRDTRAPGVKLRVKRLKRGRVRVSVRCDEDCWGSAGKRRFAPRRGVTKRFVLRTRRVKVTVSDRAGNRRVVRRSL